MANFEEVIIFCIRLDKIRETVNPVSAKLNSLQESAWGKGLGGNVREREAMHASLLS